MRSKEKIQRASFIGLAVATNILAACSDRGPTEQNQVDSLSTQYSHSLVLERNPFPTPTQPPSTPIPTIALPVPTRENDYENRQLLNELENESLDEYVVHWNNFDFGHNLETVRSHNDLIVKYSKKNQLPPDVIAGIIFVESNGFDNGNEKTGVGKMGVMPKGPLLPRRPEAKELLDDEENISWGSSILEIILHNEDPETGGQEDMFLAVALYNAGHVDLLLLQPHGWYYAKKVFNSIGMKDEFNAYIERNNIQLED